MINYNEQFEREYAKLNDAQKTAVDAIYGPVMVIAGPGTGKTQILASRIGNILRSPEAQANPDNILCLTYTESAAVNMRQRLLRMIGPDAYRISINTFHAFCNSVILENKEKFGTSGLSPISDLEQVKLMRDLIDSLPADHALKRLKGSVYYDADHLRNLFEEMEKENWTVAEFEKGIDVEIEKINTDPARKKKTGDKGLLATAKTEIERLEKSRPAAKLLPEFFRMMEQVQRYTYQQMILWVLDAFKTDDDLLAGYRELFQYILVDEYQDTNGAQNDLLWLLAGDDDNPNIFVVGDDDQAIYRFQGASSTTMLEFRNRFSKHIKLVVLTENYRSTQPILDASRALINHNSDRLSSHIRELDKNLRSASAFTETFTPVITEYANEAQQTIFIANRVKQLRDANIPLNDVVVIYRSHKEADTLIRYFDAEKIPYNVKRSYNILEDPFIKKLLTLLEYTSAESKRPHSAEHLLFEILHYDFFDIAPIDIARLSVEINADRNESKQVFWREKIMALDTGSDSHRAIKTLSRDIEYWIGNVYNLTLQQLVEKMVIRGGILTYIMLQPDKHWYMEMLNSFFGFLKGECEKLPALTIEKFLETITLMKEAEVSLPLNKVINDSNGVVLTTAHGSKGEEYRYVFLVNANENLWGKGKRAKGFKIPQNLYSTIEDYDPVNDERRLFFVAMTRAKTHLEISYVLRSMDGKEQEKSRFVAELEQVAGLGVKRENITAEAMFRFQNIIMREEEVPPVTLFDKTYIDHLLKDYRMSVTHLSNYLRCPVRFYFINILRVPSAKNESMEFGTAMHDVLQKVYYHTKFETGQVLPLEKARSQFAQYMTRHRESFTGQQFQNRLDLGYKLLAALYPAYIEPSHKNVDVEERFKNIHCGGIPITGILDKIEYFENDINVVDYKTGKFDSKKFTRPEDAEESKATHETRHGGDYWRQGVFYALIIENYKVKKMNFQSAEFVFIEPDTKTNQVRREKIFPTTDDRDIVREQIQTVWKKIHDHEFETGCGEEDCDWCNFLKRTRRREKTTEIELTDNIQNETYTAE